MSVMQCQRILQMTSPLKSLDRFTPNFTEMFFESTKVRRIQFYVELCLPNGNRMGKKSYQQLQGLELRYLVCDIM